MRYFFSILVMAGTCLAATVNNVEELFAHKNDTGTITIAPGTYNLSELEASLTFAPRATGATWTIEGAGDVNINGGDLYNIGTANSKITFQGSSSTGRFIFSNGNYCCFYIQSSSSACDVNFTYCDFCYSSGISYSNGFQTINNLKQTKVVCNNSRAYNNNGDGFSLVSSTCNQNEILTLNNCEAWGNDYDGSGSGDGDGITAHEPKQLIYINGGYFHNNKKSGLHMIGGSSVICRGANFYNNGGGCGNVAQFKISDKTGINGFASIEDCNFYVEIGATSLPLLAIDSVASEVKGCTFDAAGITSSSAIKLLSSDGNPYIDFEYNVLKNLTASGYYMIDIESQYGILGKIKNNTFYNNTRHLYLGTKYVNIQNNIFYGATQYGIKCFSDDYSSNIQNGYNCFYNNAVNIHSDTGGLRSTDITSDPCFTDVNNGDYHLKSEAGRWDPNSWSWVTDAVTSLCIDAGDPNSDWTAELWPHGKRINIGAYGGTPQASMSLSIVGNIADLDNNDSVDFLDFARFADSWQNCQVLLPEDLDRDGFVDYYDLDIFFQNWLD